MNFDYIIDAWGMKWLIFDLPYCQFQIKRKVSKHIQGVPPKMQRATFPKNSGKNRKPVFIIYTLLGSYVSQLNTMKKSPQ